ncbi:PAS domain S-box protein [Sphingomonas sp. Sphisp140]|uniref:PAS domain S-box protein n=1 Tax=unclassified Sphingomonas TaxID=196159 RepID=UPI0039AEAA7D
MTVDYGSTLEDIFPGDSVMAQTMRAQDWAATPLGPPEAWPEALTIPLRMLLTSRFEMWLGWGPDLHFFYNDAYIPTLGIKHPVMLGRPFREVWSEVYEDVADQVERVRAGESTWNKALLLLLERNGYPEETYHSFSYSPLRNADGTVGGMLCIVSEETKRIIDERRLGTLRQLGMALVGAADEASVHGAVRAVLGSNRRDFPFALFLAPQCSFACTEDAAALLGLNWQHAIGAAGDTARSIALDADRGWPSGDWVSPPREALAIAISGPSGEKALGTLILGLNPNRPDDSEIGDFAGLIAGQISGALANIGALDAERRRADRIWTHARDLMVVIGEDGRIRSASPAWTRILGHAVEDVVGNPFEHFVRPDAASPAGDALRDAAAQGELTDYETRMERHDGDDRWIAWHTSREDGLIYAYGRDISERKQTQIALRTSENQFRHLVQGVVDYAIYMIDTEGHVSSWNAGARRIKGYEPEEIIGAHFSRFYTPEDRESGEPDKALATARAEGRFAAEGWRVRKDGERFRASVVIDAVRDDAGELIGFAKITRDITERDQAQRDLEVAREALFQSQKMEAIGQLTGGVAHDFNNLLMAIQSSLALLRKRLPGGDAVAVRLLDNATEGAQRGATLTQRMLAFARRQELKADRVEVPGLLSGMSDLVQRSIGPEWPISTSLPLGLPAIRADANQLEMALLNLIVNARDAMPSGGQILISAGARGVPGPGTPQLAAGRYVCLSVTDSGAGMDAETLRRATEPFFTTKGVGKGTGLGLPMVHGMAQQIGGTFELKSSPGSGTTATLWLPVDTAEPELAIVVPSEEQVPALSRLNVLAVDDDTLVLINTAALLEDLGHSVVEADSGAEALALLETQDDIDLIITDQAMPGMTGVDLLAAVRALRPDLPAIVASGYGEGVEIGDPGVIRLSKPFTQAHLARALSQALERRG